MKIICKFIFFITFIISLTAPSYSFKFSSGNGFQYYYSANSAAAGQTQEYNVEFPLGKGTFGRLSYLSFNYFGKLNGIRLQYEYSLFGKEEKSVYSFRLGTFYTLYWGSPVITIKDGYVDQLPGSFHEIGVSIRPIIFYYKDIPISIFDLFVAFNPLSFKKVNYGATLISMGFLL